MSGKQLAWAIGMAERGKKSGRGWGDDPIAVSGLGSIMANIYLAADLPSSNHRDRFLIDAAVTCEAILRSVHVYDGFERMRAEYQRAIGKHGIDKVLTSPTMGEDYKFFAVVEEIGEVARCLTYDQDHAGDLVEEVVQLGGLCLAWAQGIHDSQDEV